MHTIELDCPPGGTRPGDLIGRVLEGIPVNVGDPVSKFFGNWTWIVPEEATEAYEEHRETVEERITALYHAGAIRYGSW
jgi:hypothetical protein